MQSVNNADENAVELLLKYGARLQGNEYGKTPLKLARNKHLDKIEAMLIAKGAQN